MLIPGNFKIIAFVDGVRKERERAMAFETSKLRSDGSLRFLPEDVWGIRREFGEQYNVPLRKVKIIQIIRIENVL